MTRGRQFWRVTGFGCLVATCLGLFYAVHMHWLGEDGKPISWVWALTDYLSFWLGWGIFSGAIWLLVDRFPIAPGHRRNLLVHFAAASIISPLHSSLLYSVEKLVLYICQVKVPWQSNVGYGKTVLLLYPRGVIYSVLIIAIVHALNYYGRYEERARAASALEAQLAQAKLHLLKMQLHPHFLFNTLNSISALLHEDVEQADLMIERLGDFLRLTLDHSTAQDVSLREELDFVNCYLSIEQIRLQDRLVCRIHAEPDALDVRVPVLILQPIVENAIRHAIAPRLSKGHLDIEASRTRSALLLKVRDNGPGLRSEASPAAGKGMGLSITRARLERFYGTAHRFELANVPEGGLLVTLEIPA